MRNRIVLDIAKSLSGPNKDNAYYDQSNYSEARGVAVIYVYESES